MLSERIAAANLESDHYTIQLIERLVWATSDAEAFEAQPAPSTRASRRPPSRERARYDLGRVPATGL